ncbi:hypothetical protein DNH61_24675 [Paenibacillus sambharensis]|uniref:Uncharacterized protein n=1 Tax=Paenibacillus sambharensis TaxID=1803190 RepID=A0A2W1L4L3_9BACL|nr:hypothetical protein [Paenibacillus sambharensis]PZD93130.1 hypothetical protein DNH61_24675 [Paenibacillus sambharensis]
MFENFEFKPGKITYNPYKLSPEDLTDLEWVTEDMVQIEYPNSYILDVGWYGDASKGNGKFVVYIIKEKNWEQPVYREEHKTLEDLYERMKGIIKTITNISTNNEQNIE